MPWTKLTQESTILRIVDVFVLLQPKDVEMVCTFCAVSSPLKNLSASEQSERDFTTKMSMLNVANLMGLDQLDDENDSNEGSYFPFGQQLTDYLGYIDELQAKILDNVQIFIENVHIRVEDTVSTKGNSPSAYGITLRSLKIQSTNEDWSPQFVTKRKLVYKARPVQFSFPLTRVQLVDIDSFDFYFETKPQAMASELSSADYALFMKKVTEEHSKDQFAISSSIKVNSFS